MEDLKNESLDTQNQDVENATENQENVIEDDNETITISKKEWNSTLGKLKYYQTGYKREKNKDGSEPKSTPAQAEEQPKQRVEGDNETLINSLRIDNPSLSREDALELSKTIKKVASVNGTSIYEALNDDYVKSQISNKISNQKDIKATAKTSHVASEISNKKFNPADLF